MQMQRFNGQNFLDTQKKLAEEMLKQYKEEITAEWDQTQKLVLAEISEKIKTAKTKFNQLQIDRQVGEPEYVQLSFLRSGVLLQSPWYRIDLHDKNWQISEIECCEKWQPVFLDEKLRKAQQVFEENFTKQSAAGMYCCEQILLQMAEELHIHLLSLLPELFEQMSAQYLYIFAEPVSVYCGEFLDKSEKVFQGRL